MRALNHMSLLMDGRVRPSILSGKLNEVLHLERKEDLIGVCIDIEHMCWKNPGLAMVVDQAAEQGDPLSLIHISKSAWFVMRFSHITFSLRCQYCISKIHFIHIAENVWKMINDYTSNSGGTQVRVQKLEITYAE